MADKTRKEYEIHIGGLKESVDGTKTLNDALGEQKKQFSSTTEAMEHYYKVTGEAAKKQEEFARLEEQAAKKAIKNQYDLDAARKTVNENLQKYMDGATMSYNEQQQLLTALGKVIKNTTGDTSQLVEQYKKLNDQLKATDETMGNHQRNVGDYRGALKEASGELKNLKGEMMGLEQGSEAFNKLAKEAGALQDKIGDINAAIKRQASDTKHLDDVINLAQSATAAFELYKGAMSAFGFETEEAEKAMQKLVGAMSIIQSLQTLSETLQASSASAKLFNVALKVTGAELVTNQMASIKATVAQDGLSKAQKVGAVAAKTFGLALKAIPLMLVIGLITTLVLHWEDFCGWLDKTFPALKKVGGAMNALKGVIVGVGKAVLHWLVNPWETFAKVIKKIMEGDFKGAISEAVNGAKNQFTGLGDAFKEGFQNQVEKGLEDITRKQAEEQDKQLTHQKNMITKQKNADGSYRKEYIEANKKMFENKKKMYKKDSDEYNKVLEDEAAFYQQVEDAKTAATKKGTADRTKVAKEAAREAAKLAAEEEKKEKERQKALVEATKNLSAAYYKTFQIELKELLRQAGLDVEKYSEGPLSKLIKALEKVENLQKVIYNGERYKSLEDLFNGADENIKKLIGSVDELSKHEGYLSLEQLELQKQIEATFKTDTEIETFQKNLEAFQESVRAIVLTYSNDVRIAQEDFYKKIADARKKEIDNISSDVENVYKKIFEDVKEFNVGPVRRDDFWGKFLGLTDEKKTLKKLEYIKGKWVKAQEEITDLINKETVRWDEYLSSIEKLYGIDSQKYKKAQEEKYKALEKLLDMQNEIAKRASSPTSGENDYNGDNNPDAPKPKKQLWYGKGEKDDRGKEYSIVDNLANLFNELDEMVLAPAMDTFEMFMDFAIEETQQRLEEVEKMHDDALDKVEESANKIQELNDKLKDSSNTNIEVTKQQLADEQILYAQRLAEERKLAEEEKNLKNKAAQQEANARKMELRYQLVMGIANTAQGASKALADWGWPLGPIFAGLMAALGAVQTALIAKQIGAIKPVKYAEGGLLEGPSHKQGGIRIPGTNVEVEGKEFVVNKRSTKKYLPLLEAINADKKEYVINRSSINRNKSYETTNKVVRMYSEGGLLNIGDSQDSIQIGRTGIEVDRSELVVDRRSTVNYIPLFEAVNVESRKSIENTDKRIRKFANGGQVNFERVDETLNERNNTNRLLNAIDKIDFQPVVAVKDIWKVEDRLVKVRGLAGK